MSVVIPTFNRAPLVREAVASVLAQRDVACEVIVVDDGSTDGTAALLSSELGDAVQIIRTDNRGVSAARNLGVRRSRGELIAFLDSDDVWLPDKLKTQVDFHVAHPQAQISQTEEKWIRHGRHVNQRRHHHKPSGWIFDASLHRCLVGPSAVMLRRDLFERRGGFDESLPVCEDYDLWLRIARDTEVWLIDQALVIKRGGHADQLSRQHWGMDRFRVAALAKLLAQECLTPDQREAALAVLTEKCRILAEGASKRGLTDAAQCYSAIARTCRDNLPPPIAVAA